MNSAVTFAYSDLFGLMFELLLLREGRGRMTRSLVRNWR